MNKSEISNSLISKKRLHPVFWFILGVMFVFLFVGGPDYYSNRLFRQVWDIGHIIFFSLLIYAVLSTLRVLQGQKFIFKFIFVIGVSLVLGLVIEWVQIGLDRSSEMDDVIRDLIGGLIPLIFVTRFSVDLQKGIRYSLRIILLMFLLYFLSPMFISFIDEVNARNQFPILSDFETPLEISRWSDENEMEEETIIIIQGKSSLKVVLNTEEYAGITLKHFPGDWQGFAKLKFSIYNSLNTPLSLEFRLNDEEHIRHNQSYHDRFNRSYDLRPGWNNLEIDLNEVKNSPGERVMDMSRISSLRIFVNKLNKPVTIYLDNFYLSN